MPGYMRFIVMMAVTCSFGLSIGPATNQASGQIAIQPAFVEVNLEGGRPSGQFVITNVSQEEQRYRINARYFNYTPTGTVVYPEDDPRSLAEWIRFNPTEFVVPPESSRAVRFVILPRGGMPPGEYWAAMSLDQLNVRETRVDAGDGRALRLTVSTSLLVPIFGHIGEIVYGAELVDVQAGPTEAGPTIAALVRNTGEGRLVVVGTYRVMDASGRMVAEGEIGHSYVMAESERVFHQTVAEQLPEGRYLVEVSYKMDRLNERFTRQTTLDWTPPPASAPADTPPAANNEQASSHASQPDNAVADSHAGM